MDIFTHALLPVILTGAATRRADLRGKWSLIAIGIAGALPDVLSPHVSLEARMMSWSHGLPCWGVLSLLVILVVMVSRGRISIALALILCGAYLLHILCDAISGGVNFLYPLGDWKWGSYWVDPIWWIPLDVICFLICYWMFRYLPMLRSRRSLRKNKEVV